MFHVVFVDVLSAPELRRWVSAVIIVDTVVLEVPEKETIYVISDEVLLDYISFHLLQAWVFFMRKAT